MSMRPEIFTPVGAASTTYQLVGHYPTLTIDASRDLLARHQRISQQEDCTVTDVEPIRSEDDTADMNNSDGKDGRDTANAAIALSVAESDGTDTDLAAGRTQGPSNGMDCHIQGETLDGVAPHQDGPCVTIEQPVQNLGEDGSQEFLMSEFANISGSPELDFLWSDSQYLHSFVSNDFFTTDLSIADISQKFTAPPDQIQTASPRPVTILSQETLPEHSRPQQTLVSRLPSLEPDSGDPGRGPEHSADSKRTSDAKLWRLTSEAYQGIAQECHSLCHALPPSFQLPSRLRMSRYLEGYFRGFHDHMPFLHTASFKPETAELNLVLAMAAVGALYKFEHARGYELYEACHHLVFWHLRRRRATELAHLRSASPTYASMRSSLTDISNQSTPTRSQPSGLASESSATATPKLHLLQSLVIMLALTSWGDRALVPSSLSMSSEAATLAREIGISKAEHNLSYSTTTWEQWVKREERRRTLFVTYILTNLQSIAFNVPPMILNNEVALLLPASAAEWRASNSTEWAAQSQSGGTSRSMRQTLHLLLQGVPAHHEGSLSAFGNYVLIHNLLQQIFFVRQASSFPIPGGNLLPTAFVKQMQSALRAWQETWEATHESTLDPSSPKGPLGFNATALLRLAHIRLSVNIGPDLHLMTRDPKVIATSYVDINLDADQNARNMDWAVLQAIHALSIPVRVGVEYVARTQTLNWSVQHALCNLECSLLLVHWLTAIANRVEANSLGSLRPDQAKLLNMTVSLVRETDMQSCPGTDQYCPAGIRHLAASVAKLWAETFNGFHVFEMVHIIGTGISMVAENLAAHARIHETQATAN